MEYCKKHKRTKFIHDEYGEYLYCPKCEEEEDKIYEEKLNKTCHWCLATPSIEIGDAVVFVDYPIYLRFAHGGRKKKKGDYVKIGKNGYLVKSRKRTNLVVVK